MRQHGHFLRQHGGTSFALDMGGDYGPVWRHWGAPVAGNVAPIPLIADWPTPSFSLDTVPPLTLLATFGTGWANAPALRAHRDGGDFCQQFRLSHIDEDATAIAFHLVDDVAQLSALVRWAFLPGGAVAMSTALTNQAARPLTVEWLAAASLPLPPDAAQVHSFTGRHNAELVTMTDALGRAEWSRTNRRGLTSHNAMPCAWVATSREQTFAAQLAWSGNSHQLIAPLDDGRYVWMMGVWLAPGEGVLAPGATMTTPAMIVSHGATGDAAFAAQRAAIRSIIQWPGGAMTPRPVHLNSWEGYYFDHDEARMMRLADAAADMGAERFILDDGWFVGRDDDTRALGDWVPDDAKYPRGLKPLAEHVIAHGMQFGLWFEPEMISPDSDLYRANPDWVLRVAGRALVTGRNQLVLDLSRPDVQDHLFAMLDRVLGDLPIAYVKWDHNRELAMAGDGDGRAAYVAQVAGMYRLLARVRTAHPAVEIEACAGGGGRIDAGILAHTHRIWTSDCIDALSRLSMQAGFLKFFPPEIMGSHIGASPAHATGRQQSIDFRAAVACQGHFGLEFDVANLDAETRARLAPWVAFYRSWRHLLHGDVWFGEGADDTQWHAAGDADAMIVMLFRRGPMTVRYQPPQPLPFVGDGRWRVVPLFGDGAVSPRAAVDDDASGRVYAGDWLRVVGLPVPPMKAERVTIYSLQRE